MVDPICNHRQDLRVDRLAYHPAIIARSLGVRVRAEKAAQVTDDSFVTRALYEMLDCLDIFR
jgi:hypothetical protein